MRLENKIIIVTGSGQGLGKTYALALAREGAKVVVSDISAHQAENTANEIRNNGNDAIAIPTDVSIENDANRLAIKAVSRLGRIDVLVNNAAMYSVLKKQPFYEINVDEWDKVLAVNLKGAWLCAKAVFPHMRKQGGGKIVNISSASFFSVPKGLVHYISSKAGIIGLTRALAKELGEYNITVNALAPGLTLTETNRTMEKEYLASVAETRALKRNQYPQDLVGTMIYLCSSDSDFVTGQTIVVDGGRVVH
jgi:3-oxoacyl-[acyl-carrier protein] reductase